MAATGGNGPLAPHMRPFIPRRRVKSIEDNPPSKRMHFLPGSGGGYPSRHGDGNRDGDGDSDGDGDGNGDGDDDGDGDGDGDGNGDGDCDNNQITIVFRTSKSLE